MEGAEGRVRQTRRERRVGTWSQDYQEYVPLPMLCSVEFERQFQPSSHPIESSVYGQFVYVIPNYPC